MLKIKDNVDLKELEKFGFLKCCDFANTYQENNYGFYVFNDSFYIDFQNDNYHKLGSISFAYEPINTENIDKLYDLIKADLVEKIEEEKEK